MYILPQEQENGESETVLSTVTEYPNWILMWTKKQTRIQKKISQVKLRAQRSRDKGKPQNAQAIAPKTSVKNYLTQK